MKRTIIGYILAIVLVASAAVTLVAQTFDVPMDVQVPLFSKILSYNRNLASRVGDRIVLGIVYQHTYKTSSAAKDEFLKTVAENKVTSMGGVPFSIVLIDIAGTSDVELELETHKVTIAYITPLRAFDVEELCRSTQQRKILTLTGVSTYVDRGASIGIGMQNDRPEIIINLPSSKAEGAEFNSHFLKLVKVVQ